MKKLSFLFFAALMSVGAFAQSQKVEIYSGLVTDDETAIRPFVSKLKSDSTLVDKLDEFRALIEKKHPSDQHIYYVELSSVQNHEVKTPGDMHVITSSSVVRMKVIPSQMNKLPSKSSATPCLPDDGYVEVVEEYVVEDPLPFCLVSTEPLFQGGDPNTFSKWVNQRLVYPEIAKENGVQGRVVLQFTVSVDGTVTGVRCISSPYDFTEAGITSITDIKEKARGKDMKLYRLCSKIEKARNSKRCRKLMRKLKSRYPEEYASVCVNYGTSDASLVREAIRVVSMSPKWTPGKQRERFVPVTYTFPIVFMLR